MLERALDALALLTAIPAGRSRTLEGAARGIWAFPLVGAAVGAAAGGAAAGLALAGAEPLLAAVMAAAALALLTGMHHLDGLADLADALMARGPLARRVAALKDRSVGAAGAASVALCLMALVAALHPAGPWGMLGAMVSAEAIAKLSMVALMRARAAAPGSSAAPFVAAARSRRAVAAAAAVALGVSVAVSGPVALGAAAAGVAVALAVGAASARRLGGLRGDALGAANELSRVAAVAILVAAQ